MLCFDIIDIRSWFHIKMNSVYVKHSKEVNEKKGIRDFYLFDDKGEIVIDGSMGLDEAFEKIKTKNYHKRQ